MSSQYITIITFGYFDKHLFGPIAQSVMTEFQFPVRFRDAHIDLSEFYDPVRRQYNGNTLLQKVESLHTTDSVKVVGLLNVDLFIPILTYIFGQAILGGKSAVASSYRLNNEFYGMPADRTILSNRFRKEIVHELGHTFGLIHCKSPGCVMQSSTYVEDIDLKNEHLCPQCRGSIVNPASINLY